VAGWLFVRMRRTTSRRAETLEGGSLLNDRGLNDECVGGKIVVVFRIRDGRLERLADETCRLARKISTASAALRPWMALVMSRTFFGDMRAYFV